LDETYPAVDLLGRFLGHLDDETALALRMSAYARAGLKSQLAYEFNTLLSRPLSPSIIKLPAAHLIRYPDPELSQNFYAKFERAALSLITENAGSHFSMRCRACVHRDRARLGDQITPLKSLASASFLRLSLAADLFNNESAARLIAIFIPILPVPLEVTFALLQRYPGTSTPSLPATRRTP
jgi:hypothetical protein